MIVTLYIATALGNTIVYNLRIAETTLKIPLKEGTTHNYLGAATTVAQVRNQLDTTKLIFFSELGTFVYYAQSYFIRLDAAFANARIRTNGVTLSQKTETDDLLFTGGYGHTFNDQMSGTFSALAGFPTHGVRRIDTAYFGYAHYSLGAQVDFAYLFNKYLNSKIIIVGRGVHFFKRDASRIPLLVRLDGGNIFDIFCSYGFGPAWTKFDIGYDGTLFSNFIQTNIQVPLYIRNSFYATCTHSFKIKEHSSACMLGISYSFDNKPEIGFKNIITAWASLWMRF